MYQNSKNLRLIIKIIIILTFVGIYCFFWYQKISVTTLTYVFDENFRNQFVYGPYPKTRAILYNQQLNIISEPIYFDVYSPKKFSAMEISLACSLDKDSKLHIGIRESKELWQYKMLPLNCLDGQQIVKFDLQNIALKNNKYQLIFSEPALTIANSKPIIQSMKIILN